MRWEVVVRSRLGRSWRLTGDRDSPVRLKQDGMSGMVASSVETMTTQVGRPGSQLVASRVDMLAPSWELVFVARDGADLGQVVSEWLQAWRDGVTVTVETPGGSWSTQGRVPPDAGVDFGVNPFTEARGHVELSWSWVADRPVWEMHRALSGGGEVLNFGDVVCTPSVEWSGSGQSITVGGSTFSLPNAGERARMILDHADNCVVTGMQGEKLVNASEWSRRNAMGLSTVIPPGESATVAGSSGVDVVWSVGVKSPWR